MKLTREHVTAYRPSDAAPDDAEYGVSAWVLRELIDFYLENGRWSGPQPEDYCTRESGHDGPCNGLPRRICQIVANEALSAKVVVEEDSE